MNKTASGSECPVVTCACQVMGITPLSTQTFEVELEASAEVRLGYRAGQYLQLALDVNGDGQMQFLSYSIANRFNPEQPRRLQLFIHNNSDFSGKILKHLSELHDKNAQLTVTLPKGRAFLQTDLDLPHVLVAAGSGIAKIKCITEELLRQNPEANVKIYWSNKNVGDFYLLDEFQGWEKQNKNLSFTPILESADAGWPGRSGFIYQVIEEDLADLGGTQAYLCGSPQMVYGTIDRLIPCGLQEVNCYSDVFEYAPRGQKVAI